MSITPGFEWVWSYLEIASRYVPRLHDIKLIRFRRPKFGQIQHFEGMYARNWAGPQRYELTIYTHYNTAVRLKPYRMKQKRYSTLDVLTHLAHELAHVSHEDHTPAHKALEARILGKFMAKLQAEGYVSEEAHERRPFILS